MLGRSYRYKPIRLIAIKYRFSNSCLFKIILCRQKVSIALAFSFPIKYYSDLCNAKCNHQVISYCMSMSHYTNDISSCFELFYRTKSSILNQGILLQIKKRQAMYDEKQSHATYINIRLLHGCASCLEGHI